MLLFGLLVTACPHKNCYWDRNHKDSSTDEACHNWRDICGEDKAVRNKLVPLWWPCPHGAGHNWAKIYTVAPCCSQSFPKIKKLLPLIYIFPHGKHFTLLRHALPMFHTLRISNGQLLYLAKSTSCTTSISTGIQFRDVQEAFFYLSIYLFIYLNALFRNITQFYFNNMNGVINMAVTLDLQLSFISNF